MPSLNFDAKSLMQSQRGNDCKVIAIGAVLNWLHENKKINQKPLPARFRHQKQKDKQKKPKDGQFHSLRQVAKQKLKEKNGGEAKDQVTESIDDPEILAQVASHHPEVDADFIDCENEAHYLYIIKTAIDQGLAPIVFFDVDPSTHQPVQFNGAHEHAAIIIGYEQGWGGTSLTLAQWKQEEKVDGSVLFHSSIQLREAKKHEYYYKYPDRGDKGGRGWIPASQIEESKWLQERFPDFMKSGRMQKYPENRSSFPTKTNNHNGLGRKILLIGSKRHHGPIIAGLKAFKPSAVPLPTASHRFWQACLSLAGLSSLYAIIHSAATLILKTTLLGLSAFTASWVLFIALVALAIILITLINTRQTKTCLPSFTPEFQPAPAILHPSISPGITPHNANSESPAQTMQRKHKIANR